MSTFSLLGSFTGVCEKTPQHKIDINKHLGFANITFWVFRSLSGAKLTPLLESLQLSGWSGCSNKQSHVLIEPQCSLGVCDNIIIVVLTICDLTLSSLSLTLHKTNKNTSWKAKSRAGYRSIFFDTDTLSSIPVPERYFFRYQFYEISFNKISIISKNVGFIFFSLLTFIQTQRLISWATAQRNKIYPTQ